MVDKQATIQSNPNLSSEQNAANRNIGIIINPIYANSGNITISHTTNTTENTAKQVFSYIVGPQGALLYLLAITYDSTSATNGYYELQGINIANNVFNPMPTNSTNVDFIPSGTALFVAPNSIIKVMAYNTSSTTDAAMSVIMMVDQL